MSFTSSSWLERCHHYTIVDGPSAFQINFAGMPFTQDQLDPFEERFVAVHQEMRRIELGEIKNPDENRKVTHFTDRSVYTGSAEFAEVESFAAAIRAGSLVTESGRPFEFA